MLARERRANLARIAMANECAIALSCQVGMQKTAVHTKVCFDPLYINKKQKKEESTS